MNEVRELLGTADRSEHTPTLSLVVNNEISNRAGDGLSKVLCFGQKSGWWNFVRQGHRKVLPWSSCTHHCILAQWVVLWYLLHFTCCSAAGRGQPQGFVHIPRGRGTQQESQQIYATDLLLYCDLQFLKPHKTFLCLLSLFPY